MCTLLILQLTFRCVYHIPIHLQRWWFWKTGAGVGAETGECGFCKAWLQGGPWSALYPGVGTSDSWSWVRCKSILKFCFDFQKAFQIHRDRQKSFILKKIKGLGKLSRCNCLWTPDKSRELKLTLMETPSVSTVCCFSHVCATPGAWALCKDWAVLTRAGCVWNCFVLSMKKRSRSILVMWFYKVFNFFFFNALHFGILVLSIFL